MSGNEVPPAVVLDGVTKTFPGVTAVDDVTLAVPRGTILGVIGPSGAGKTTLIRLLTGGLRPTAGHVRVLSERPSRFRRQTRERIGYMPQLFSLMPDLTAGENVDFVASLFGMLWLKRRRRVREMLRLVELWDVRGRRASKLSGGMQRRLELACALVHDPVLLLLDEPTGGVDPLLRRSIWDELRRLRGKGRTLLVTTQYVTEAEECDAVALIARGRMIALGPPEHLRREASGGDLIEVETARAFDADSLLGRPNVRAVDQRGPRQFIVAVDDAGEALPSIDEMLREAGGEAVAAREFRLSYDDVFARLVGGTDQGAPTDPSSETAGRAA
jgi:ABC-2 type transport system ATP-binding protein